MNTRNKRVGRPRRKPAETPKRRSPSMTGLGATGVPLDTGHVIDLTGVATFPDDLAAAFSESQTGDVSPRLERIADDAIAAAMREMRARKLAAKLASQAHKASRYAIDDQPDRDDLD